MYLNDLMQGEKFAFYSIVKELVSIDGSFSDVEKQLVNGFLVEMNLVDEKLPTIKLDDAIDMLTYSSSETRKKVFIELVGVTLCDEFLHSDEKMFLDNIANRFSISNDEKDDIIDTIQQLLNIYKKLQTIVET